MTEGWMFTGPSSSPAGSTQVTLVEGRSFCISDACGDMDPARAQGLIVKDTRFLAHFQLRVDGEPLESLDVQRIDPHAAAFVTRTRPRDGGADSTLLVVRRRYVGNGLVEEVSVTNLGRETTAVRLSLSAGTDFAGLFEVKDGRALHHAAISTSVMDSTWSQSQQRGAESRSVEVEGSGGPDVQAGLHTWDLVVAPRETATVTVRVVPSFDGLPLTTLYQQGEPHHDSLPAARHARWRTRSPSVRSPDTHLVSLVRNSTDDLAGLRIDDPEHPSWIVLAAGAPWFMTVFGRDSLLTSWMLLPVDSRVARGTLETLAQHQGRTVDPVSEEQPGRILHEMRSGLDAGQTPGIDNVYYGTIDATPLFVMLLGELHRWGAPVRELEPLLHHADRALEWVDAYGDRDGDGFVEYQRATDRGLLNQGWKDSFDGISFASGVLAEPPTALAEVQGYVYAAWCARARLARAMGQDDLARDCEERAAKLKRRFNEVFWLPQQGYYAMALDGDKRPVDGLGSNMGHCLWTGIVDAEHARQVADALLGPEMFSGFGVRTLGSTMGAYNPMSYHNGSVWPHDNAIIVAGLRRYGFVEEAQRVTLALVDAAECFDDRLPELFCGFGRDEFPEPVPYPTSCAPQAWAAATPFLLLRSLLGLEPDVPGGRIDFAPALPPRFLPFSVEQIHVATETIRVEVEAGGCRVVGAPTGLSIVGARC
jgi:glycogen debranching enzyme